MVPVPRPERLVTVAEQVSVEREPAAVVAWLGRGSLRWIEPFLLLGWNEGEMALRRRGALTNRPTSARHRLYAGTQVAGADDVVSIPIAWTVTNATRPFGQLVGEFVVTPFGAVTVLGLRATCFGAADDRAGVAQTSVEHVARSLLGHLRSALEYRGPVATGIPPCAADGPAQTHDRRWARVRGSDAGPGGQ
jgi:hypothetical protein